MAYRPLHIACGVLIIALSLTATLSVTMTGLRSEGTLASGGESGEATVAGLSPATDSVAADESPYFPAAADSRPFPGDRMLTVLADGPVDADGRFVAISTNGVSHQPRPGHRGYEELPPPPEAVPQLAAAEAAVPSPVETPAPLQDLVSELSKLRQDIQQFGEAAHGHTAVQAEMHSLRTEIAAMHERHERDRIDSLQQNVERIAQRQQELESEVNREDEAPVPDPIPAPDATSVVTSAEPASVSIQPVAGQTGQWSAQLIDADPSEVIARLGEVGGWNLVLHSGVRQPVTLTLASVTTDELLHAVVMALDCGIVDDGAVRIVLPSELAAARRAAAEQTVARLIRPKFMAAGELLPLIQPMLTPGIGAVALTPEGTGDDANAPQRAQSDAILVVDYQTVVSQVEALFAEIDLPPEQFVIEAVLTTVAWNDRTQHGMLPALEQEGVCSAPLKRDRGNLQSRPARVGQCRGEARDVLHAMQLLGDVRIESSPTLHVLNRQLAEVEVGANVAYREQVAFGRRLRLLEEEIDLLPSRTSLSVRPFLQGDDTVRLQVHPRVTYVHGDVTSGLPREEVAELSTDITIPLGCTAVIGGLTQSAHEEYAGNSPISRWFGRRSRSTATASAGQQTIELVVLLTPRRACDVIPPPTAGTPEKVDTTHAAPLEAAEAPAMPVNVGPSLPTVSQEPQPVDSPPLLKRLLGKRLDAPPPQTMRTPAPSDSLAALPFPEVPPPQVLAEEDAPPLFVWENDRARHHETEPPPSTTAATGETATVETAVLPEIPTEVSATLQTSAAIEVFDPVPPQPEAPLATVPPQPAALRDVAAPPPTVAAIDQYVVPPPPPEMVVPPVLVTALETWVPPAPIGRARRRTERVERHDTRDRRERRGPDDTLVPPMPRR